MDQELRAAGRIRLDGNRVIVEPLTSTGEACLRQMAETGAIVAVVIEPMDALTACERAAVGDLPGHVQDEAAFKRGAAIFGVTVEQFRAMVEPLVEDLARIAQAVERARSQRPPATPGAPDR